MFFLITFIIPIILPFNHVCQRLFVQISMISATFCSCFGHYLLYRSYFIALDYVLQAHFQIQLSGCEVALGFGFRLVCSSFGFCIIPGATTFLFFQAPSVALRVFSNAVIFYLFFLGLLLCFLLSFCYSVGVFLTTNITGYCLVAACRLCRMALWLCYCLLPATTSTLVLFCKFLHSVILHTCVCYTIYLYMLYYIIVKLCLCYTDCCLVCQIQCHSPIINPLCTIFHYFYALYLGQPSTFIYRQLYSLFLALFLGYEPCIIRLFIHLCQLALLPAVKQSYIVVFLIILGIILFFQPVQCFCFCLSRFLCVIFAREGGGSVRRRRVPPQKNIPFLCEIYIPMLIVII